MAEEHSLGNISISHTLSHQREDLTFAGGGP